MKLFDSVVVYFCFNDYPYCEYIEDICVNYLLMIPEDAAAVAAAADDVAVFHRTTYSTICFRRIDTFDNSFINNNYYHI